MKHLDLFSGIGGFALATEMVWDNVEHVFCDNDLFCQAILKKHWPNAQIYGDIRELRFDTYSDSDGRTGGDEKINATEKGEQAQHDPPRRAARLGRDAADAECARLSPEQIQGGAQPTARPSECTKDIDLLTGGFPCQPFSQAGRRRGTQDDRYLWPEMLRVIREFHPRWIIGENVGGLVTWNNGMVLEQVQSDLESEGYSVQAFIIPAVAVNAPHRRDRVWIVAHSTDSGREHGERERRISTEATRGGKTGAITDADSNAPDTSNEGLERNGKRRKASKGRDRLSSRTRRTERTDWNQNWLEVAARLCTLDDGLPNGLARPRGWRNAALKGAGNAIVPQVAAEIMKAIKEIDI